MKDIFLKERDNVLKEKTGTMVWTGPDSVSFSLHRISQGARQTSLEEQLDPTGPIAPRGGSVGLPVFITKPIAAFDLPEVGVRRACSPSVSAIEP